MASRLVVDAVTTDARLRFGGFCVPDEPKRARGRAHRRDCLCCDRRGAYVGSVARTEPLRRREVAASHAVAHSLGFQVLYLRGHTDAATHDRC